MADRTVAKHPLSMEKYDEITLHSDRALGLAGVLLERSIEKLDTRSASVLACLYEELALVDKLLCGRDRENLHEG